MAIRPSLSALWLNFNAIDVDVASVGKVIGGKVGENILLGQTDPRSGFTNACAIRMSYCLNRSGVRITRGAWSTVSGGDKFWYIFRVRDMLAFLKHAFGKPNTTIQAPSADDFKNIKGILVFSVPFSDASGHITLWNGSICADHGYFDRATEASIWTLD
jgi:hypothetical protein